MALYIEVSVRYDKMMENGVVKKVTDKFLLDALTITEAESRTIEEITPYLSGEFSIKKAVKTKISEVLNGDAEKFYLAKVGFIKLDEKSGVEKRSITQILIGASDFDDAREVLRNGMKSCMADYDIVSISESPILEYFPAKLA